MALRVDMNFKGLEDYISKIAKAGNDVDVVVDEALNASADFMLKEMQEGVERHKKDGRAYKAIKRSEVKRSGTVATVDVGALDIRGEDQDGFHVIYQEYGSPKISADPWMTPAVEKKAEMRKIQKDILKKGGVPVE